MSKKKRSEATRSSSAKPAELRLAFAAINDDGATGVLATHRAEHGYEGALRILKGLNITPPHRNETVVSDEIARSARQLFKSWTDTDPGTDPRSSRRDRLCRRLCDVLAGAQSHQRRWPMRPGTLAEKLAEIGRRSPNDLHSLEVLADHVLDRLNADEVIDPAAYEWKCDQPRPVWKPGDPKKPKGGA